jgi:hypothetical protein
MLSSRLCSFLCSQFVSTVSSQTTLSRLSIFVCYLLSYCCLCARSTKIPRNVGFDTMARTEFCVPLTSTRNILQDSTFLRISYQARGRKHVSEFCVCHILTDDFLKIMYYTEFAWTFFRKKSVRI